MMNRRGYCILAGVAVIYIVVGIIFLTGPGTGVFGFFVRFFALFGFTTLSIAAMMSPFLKEISSYLGKPFIKVHHIFAYTGLALITLHPVTNAIQTGDISVFLPVFSSWSDFWIYAGRLALIFLYIGLLAVLIRRKIRPWRILHMIVYLVLFMAFIHGLLIGTDLYNTGMIVIFSILMALVFLSFILKRIKLARR
jgi:methionine sulfoxide reductase heme-binding subunit